MSKVKLGLIGAPSDWLISCNVDRNKLSDQLDIELVDVPVLELEENYHKVEVSKELIEEYKHLFDEDELVKALKIYLGIKIIVEKYDLKGFAIRCFDLLSSIKSTACLALAIFNKDGIIGTCEGDVPALISMYLVKKMNDEPTFQANPSQIDVEKNEIILAHCTLPLSMCTSYKLTTHFESGIGVAIKGELEEKNISIVRIASTLDKYVMLHGKIVENLKFGNLCRTQVRIKMDDDSSVSYFLKKPLGNHHIIFYGNDTKNLEAYLEAHGLVRVDSSR